MNHVHFDAEDLGERLHELDEEALHGLPFGVIGLGPDGKVRFFSRTEARQSRRGGLPTLGLHFFSEVAPCMEQGGVRERIEAGRTQGRLDLELGHTGDFADPARILRIRAMSHRDGGLWLALCRPDL